MLCIPFIAMSYSYRKAEESDREAIYQLYCCMMHSLIAEIWGWDEKWQRKDFSAHFDPQEITLVYHEHVLVGYSHVQNLADRLFIRMIVVHPDHQKKGIGRTLLESVVTLANQQSKVVGLEVFKINREVKKIYERYGFSVEDETPHSYVMSHA